MARQFAGFPKLLPIYATTLDLPAQYFNDHAGFRDPGFRVRMLHYPPQPDRKPNVFGAGPHTDYSFFNILPQSDVDGLEIMAGREEWVRAPMMPEHLLSTRATCACACPLANSGRRPIARSMNPPKCAIRRRSFSRPTPTW